VAEFKIILTQRKCRQLFKAPEQLFLSPHSGAARTTPKDDSRPVFGFFGCSQNFRK